MPLSILLVAIHLCATGTLATPIPDAMGASAGGSAVPLAPEVAGRQAGGSDSPVGPLELEILVDLRLRDVPGWRDELEAGIADAGSLLADSLERPLQLAEARPWREVDVGTDLEDLLARLLGTRVGPGREVVVGLAATEPRSPGADPRSGTPSSEGAASYEDGVAVLKVAGGLREIGPLLAHEIAHLFGAVHRPGGGLMDPDDPSPPLDSFNAAIVGLHRDRSFRTLEFAVDEERRPRLRELYRKVLESGTDPDTRQALFRLARLDIEDGRHDDCIAALKPVVAEDRGAAEAWLLLGIAYRRSGRYREAVTAYDSIPPPHDDRYQVHYDRGIALQHLGDLEGSLAAYRRAVELAPGFVPALGNLGHAYAEAGRPDEAVEVLQRALELDPDDRNALVNLAYARLVSGELEGARVAVRRVLERYPESAAAHDTLGQIHEAEGRHGEAIRQFELAADLDPSYPPALVNLARVRLETGDPEGAADAVDRARELRPGWPVVRRLRARILLASGRWKEARGELESVLEAEPELGWAWVGLGHARFEAGEVDGAVSAYDRALELGVDDGIVHNNLAVIDFRAGRIESAWRHAVRARKLGAKLHPAFVAALEDAAGRRLPESR